jgi:hypothetical protein
MKKLFIALLCVVSSFAIVSCDIVDTLVKVTEEAAEIAEGKCFTVKEGTIIYQETDNNDNSAVTTTVTFKDYGKEWASISGNDIIIVEGGYIYTLDKEEKIGIKTNYEGGYSGCPYIFWENAYRYGNKLSSSTFKEGSETIAGKKCVTFSVDGEKVGGWNRLLFLEEDGYSVVKATSFKDSATSSMFSTDGYKITPY